MNIIRKDLFLVLLFFIFWQCSAIDKTDENNAYSGQPENLDTYLLIGQSNMAGRAEILASDTDTLHQVFLFCGNANKVWERAANPLNKYSTIRKDIAMQKFGPGYTFAREIKKTTGN